MRRISTPLILVIVLSGFSGCGSSNSSPTPQQIKAKQAAVLNQMSQVLKPALPTWNCDTNDPVYRDRPFDYKERLDFMLTNCVWSFGDSTVKAVLQRVPDEAELLELSTRVQAFSSNDVAKMMETRGIDGLQTSVDRVTSWSVGANGLTLIIDIPLLMSRHKSSD